MAIKNNKKYILVRYFFVVTFMLLFAAWIIICLTRNTVFEAPKWNERAKNELETFDTIPPERGSILAANGNILACNVKAITVLVDLRDARINKNFPAIPWDKIDMLADSLDTYYPRRDDLHRSQEFYKEHSWRTRLYKAFAEKPEKRTMALVLAKKVTMDDFHRINSWPFINEFKDKKDSTKRTILYHQTADVRIYPYGRMATRSIGRVSQQEVKPGKWESHGYSGLEKALDSQLYGVPGLAKKMPMNTGMRPWVVKQPRRGFDVLSTIDIDMQDMLEEQLNNICVESNAVWGTAILMEVATGEIKALSNLEYDESTGTYIEALNRAVEAVEPGSVMKPISMMIAFEDGLVKRVTDAIDCSPFQRTKDPHAPSVKNMKQVIEMSSNTGIARVIFRGYSQHPEKFYDRLQSIGFFEPIGSGIADEMHPRVRRLTEFDNNGRRHTMEARHLDLARQAYGYNTAIPPIYTLAYYNAIANKGRMVRPHLVKGYRLPDGTDSILNVPMIRQQVCSPETAEKVKQCIHEVVWGEHGTARAVRDDRVKVVGKTGTAYPYDYKVLKGYDLTKRRYAFCGFFPYENPKYSCIALVLAPASTSANRTSGQVVKNMALKMYSRGLLDNSSRFTETKSESSPVLVASESFNSKDLRKSLNYNSAKRVQTPKQGTGVANVVGYDAPTAIRILERQGFNVIMNGHGKVVSQSPAAGSLHRRGTRVTLKLQV